MVSEWLNVSEIIDKNAKKPCHRLGWCPYGKLIEEFPIREQLNDFTCKVFQHDCPIFYHIEYTSEKYSQEDYEKEIEILYNQGGLGKVFSKDKIAFDGIDELSSENTKDYDYINEGNGDYGGGRG